MTVQTALLPGAKATARKGAKTPVPKGGKRFPDSPYFLLVVLAVHADGTVDVTRDGDGADEPLGTYVWHGVNPAVLEPA